VSLGPNKRVLLSLIDFDTKMSGRFGANGLVVNNAFGRMTRSRVTSLYNIKMNEILFAILPIVAKVLRRIGI
jgi:hypothetical protein